MKAPLRPWKRLDAEFRRLAEQELKRASADLAAPEGAEREEGIHEARKRLKHLRALLRLVRRGHAAFYKTENTRYRDAARRLSAVRDRTALIEALTALEKRYGLAAGTSFAAARTTLEARRDAAAGTDMGPAIEATLADLAEAREHASHFTLPHRPDKAGRIVASGYAETHARARKALAKAMETEDADDLHELRKHAKYQSLQLKVIEPLWPRAFAPLREIAATIADELGSDHDLAVLAAEIAADPGKFGGKEEREALVTLIGQRQSELRASAIVAAERLLIDRRSAVRRRIRRLWKVAGQKAARPAKPAKIEELD
ncbi:CHAD domain-containing protein [Consotaella salsifontis]|uniref:CHAD domain-containing protein n=1 Tax=Consotaella salsifontis TaxID=1365950 RepID=A0A1T4QT23_9HYPH|nr:CHAD domain-containing protein [Consotaella salsifontis]SKA06929.1 CHAD domain-containing protein [Consotaella salsifontis]